VAFMADSKKTRKPLGKFLCYTVFRYLFRLAGLLLFKYHCIGRHYLPKSGGAIICANHQSHLDPPLVGMAPSRHCIYLARKTLFKNPVFGFVISMLDAIPLNRDGMGIEGIKATLRKLKAGEAVVMFPEGTRTKTGKLQNLKTGFITLARRSKVPLIPCGFVGAYDCLPRGGKLPCLERIRCVYGPPISAEQVTEMSDEAIIELLTLRMQDCIRQAEISRSS
jgi:1-acyl-sn-glycerol-3-phosphate acyltransferase